MLLGPEPRPASIVELQLEDALRKLAVARDQVWALLRQPYEERPTRQQWVAAESAAHDADEVSLREQLAVVTRERDEARESVKRLNAQNAALRQRRAG